MKLSLKLASLDLATIASLGLYHFLTLFLPE